MVVIASVTVVWYLLSLLLGCGLSLMGLTACLHVNMGELMTGRLVCSQLVLWVACLLNEVSLFGPVTMLSACIRQLCASMGLYLLLGVSCLMCRWKS